MNHTEEIQRLRQAIAEAYREAERCRCHGWTGPCGCSHRIAEVLFEVMEAA